MAKIQARPFRLALCQLGPTGPTKRLNIELAQKAVAKAAASTPKPELIVLPEIWNSPYAVSSFREYAERIPAVGSTGAEGEEEGETVKAMREMAKSAGVWLIGGELYTSLSVLGRAVQGCGHADSTAVRTMRARS